MKTTFSRRTFDPAFKLQVVQMVKLQGVGISQGCQDPNLVDVAVRR